MGANRILQIITPPNWLGVEYEQEDGNFRDSVAGLGLVENAQGNRFIRAFTCVDDDEFHDVSEANNLLRFINFTEGELGVNAEGRTTTGGPRRHPAPVR